MKRGLLMIVVGLTLMAFGSPPQQQERTDEETAARIVYFVNCYGYEMQPGNWQINLVKLDSTDQAWARTRIFDWRRMEAAMGFNIQKLRVQADSVVRRVVIHEMAHLLSGELSVIALAADTLLAVDYSEVVAIRIETQPVWRTVCNGGTQ